MIKKILFTLGFNSLLFGFISQAQSELTLPFVESVHQSSYVNAASLPDHKVSIGLPGISSNSFDITNTGFSYNDVVNDVTKKYDPYKALKAMSKENYMNVGMKIDLFSFRLKARSLYFTLNVTENINFKISYPKDLFSLMLKGNYDQPNFDFTSLGINASHTREYGLGVTHEGKKMNIGGRFRLIQGFENIYTRTDNLKFNTDINNGNVLSASAKGQIFTSIPESIDEKTYLSNFGNVGGGIDLAVSYKFTPKWQLTLAANNIGFIDWKSNLRSYEMDGKGGFDGADILGPYVNGKDFRFSEIIDSLNKAFKLKETEAISYRTWLTPQFYAMLNYNVLKHTSIGAALFLEAFVKVTPTGTVAVQQKVGKMLSATLSYSAKFGQFNNLGLGLVFKPGPFDFYIIGDNILLPVINYASEKFYVNRKMVGDLRTVNFRVGMNLVFGRIKRAETQSYWGI
jgi:hypothetical protein